MTARALRAGRDTTVVTLAMRTTVLLVVAAVLVPLIPLPGAKGAAAPPSAPPNTVTAFGTATGSGANGSAPFPDPIVDIAGAGDSGYWITSGTGEVAGHGTAAFFGSLAGSPLNRPVVGIAATPSAGGYRLVGGDGGVFNFGDARFRGSLGGRALNSPVVDIASTPTGEGYWLVAADGGVFSFGDAPFAGSLAGVSLRSPIVGMAATPSGTGYWLSAENGAVFALGDAEFYGGADGGKLPAPITGIAAGPGGQGYWLVSRDGQAHAFGLPDKGSPVDAGPVDGAATAIAAASDAGYWVAHGEPLETGRQSGRDVEALQRRLTELGYWLGPVNGTFGPLSEQAVYAFQKVEGLAATGRIDQPTRRRLIVAERPRAASPAGDLLEVDKAHQVLFVVRDGLVAFTFNASTGTERSYFFGGRRYRADTPPGRFVIHREVDGVVESRLGRLVRPKYFQTYAGSAGTAGIAIHGFSFVPPYAASHGCVRLSPSANDFIWSDDLAPVGSAVSVYGTTPPPPAG